MPIDCGSSMVNNSACWITTGRESVSLNFLYISTAAEGRVVASALKSYPREMAAHLTLSAHARIMAKDPSGRSVTPEALTEIVQMLVGEGVDVPGLDDVVGEM